MTRCGGATGACTCSVTAGTGVTVTGDGSPETPYRVSQSSGTAGLKVTDTGTVDMTVTGSGTPSAPFDLSAAVKRSADAGNTLAVGADGGLFVAPAGAADPGAVISADPGNAITEGAVDGLLYAPAWQLGLIGEDLSDYAQELWEFTVNGTTYNGRPVPGYTPATGQTSAGLFGGPGYWLLFGTPAGEA